MYVEACNYGVIDVRYSRDGSSLRRPVLMMWLKAADPATIPASRSLSRLQTLPEIKPCPDPGTEQQMKMQAAVSLMWSSGLRVGTLWGPLLSHSKANYVEHENG
jgi:hypothetical protein